MNPYLIETKAGYVDGQTEYIVCEDLQLLDQFSHRGVREVNIDEELTFPVGWCVPISYIF